MIKAIFLIKRKKGTTVEQFRKHYEERHVGVALEFIRPYLSGYRRNYPAESSLFFDTNEGAADTAVATFEYDCITEMSFESEDKLQAMFDKLSEPEVRAVVGEDEERFIDSQSVVYVKCEEHQTVF